MAKLRRLALPSNQRRLALPSDQRRLALWSDQRRLGAPPEQRSSHGSSRGPAHVGRSFLFLSSERRILLEYRSTHTIPIVITAFLTHLWHRMH